MHRILGIFALTGFFLALTAHIAAWCGVAVSEHVPFIWVLHVGVFVVFIPMVLAMNKTLGSRPSFQQIRAGFPAWVVVAGIGLLAWTMFNFMLSMSGLEGEPGLSESGRYVLSRRGQLIREINFDEFTRLKALQVRAFSGHWLLFYFVPYAYFMFYRKPAS